MLELIQRHGLLVIAGAHTFQQRGQRHRPIAHRAFVGNVLFDADILGLRMAKQFGAAPLARCSPQFKVQLRRRQWQAQEQR